MLCRNSKLLGTALFTAIAIATAGGITMAADGGRVKTLALKDDCDPATFNAPAPAGVGPGTCVGGGDTTFAEFIGELQQDRVAEDWEIDPDDLDVQTGQCLRARNEGGEAHTFTEVGTFGGGFVPPLNALSGNPTPAAECLAASVGATIVPAGGLSAPTAPLSNGTHRFQCCIHPWMRTVVTVETKR